MNRTPTYRVIAAWLTCLVLGLACSSDPPPPANSPQQPYPPNSYSAAPYPSGAYPGGTYPPGSYPSAQPQPGAAQPPPPQPQPPPAPPAAALPPVTADPITNQDLGFMRSDAQNIILELIAVLPPAQRQRVQGIPLVVDSTVGEVNAFASCSNGKSAMAITDGLLRIEGILAQAKAHDEVFGTTKVDEYIRLAASQMRPKQPIPRPPAGFFPGANDPRVVARQHQVFDEQVAFVLGHELGHHYLGHLPCTAGKDPWGAADAARVLSDQVPLFNQPNELAADLAGTQNILNAGKARAARGAYAWTEAGGLLTMRFFAGFSSLTPGNLLTAFERSHPPPQIRTPVIQTAANNWRSTGGAPFPIPALTF